MKHIATIKNKYLFSEFTTEELQPGVAVILGKEGDKNIVQSYEFLSEKFTADQVKEWIEKQHMKTISINFAEELKTYSIKEKEILKVGRWRCEDGRTVDITENDLDNVIEAYSAGVYSKDGVNIRIGGHDKYLPFSGGTITKLIKKGETLLADIADIPGQIKEAIEKKLFKSVSSGLVREVEDALTNKEWPVALQHLALLGPIPPGCKGLLGWNGTFLSEDNASVYEIISFSENDNGELVQLDIEKDKREKEIKLQEEKKMDDKLKQKNEQLVDEVANLSEGQKKLETSLSEKDKEIERLKNEGIERDTKAKEKAVDSFLESEDITKRVIPAQRELIKKVLLSADDLDLEKKKIEALPIIESFEEKGGEGETKEELSEKKMKEKEDNFIDELKTNEGKNKKVVIENFADSVKAKQLVKDKKYDSLEDAFVAIERGEV